ncbi:MAG: molybdopterin-dependent oxidoreductase [Polyangiaceae bacterium]|nr:molybdopterin-dependent oxidoreductase [Polyangiaceae bacterium]
MAQTVTTFCRICEVLCGLEADVENGRVTALRPDANHVTTHGFACPKGLKQHQMYTSVDRLHRVETRDGETWSQIDWDTALGEIGAKVKQIVGEHGPNAVAMYVGTAAGFSVLHPIFAQGFMTGIGSKNMYATATQDCANKFAVARAMYGFPFTQPFPDLDRTECLIVTGANPVVSKWSFLQVPNPAKKLKSIEARGGKVFFVDPRRTESAKTAGEHVFIRPDTDVFFFLAFLNELFAQNGVDRERAEKYTSGIEVLRRLTERWTPERCAEITQIPAEKLREMVSTYRLARGAALYCSTGVNMGSRGSLSFWLQESINAISGNLDRSGGTLVGKGVFDFPAFGKKTGTLLRNDRSRIGDFTSVNDAFPGGILADEILTPGPNQVRALFVTGGNPLITMPNSERLKHAFSKLDLLVTVDLYKNETGSLAHYILPATSPLERPDLPFIFPLFLGLQTEPYLQATHRIAEPQGEQRDEATIYLDLCKACGVNLFGSKAAQRTMEWARNSHSKKRPGKQPSLPLEGLLSGLLRLTGQGSFQSLAAHKHGRKRPAHASGTFLPERVLTDDGKVNLAPESLVSEAERTLEESFEAEKLNRRRLKLITKRATTTHNSWTHNLPDFVAGERGTNYLFMHPQDALERELSQGDLVDVTTPTHSVRVPLRLLSDLMPGTVAMPHGWGHQHAQGLSVARQTRGVNVNLLAADGPNSIERIAGMAHLTGFIVEVTRASGPQAATWSGLGNSTKT